MTHSSSSSSTPSTPHTHPSLSVFHCLRSLQQRPFAGRWEDLQHLRRIIEDNSGEEEEEKQLPGSPLDRRLYPLSLVTGSALPYVFLAFSRSGAYLISYRRGSAAQDAGGEELAGDSWCLQLWLISPPQPLRLSCEVRVWTEERSSEEVGDVEHPWVAVLESDDQRLMLVQVQAQITAGAVDHGVRRSTYTAFAVPSPSPPLLSSSPSISPCPSSSSLSFCIDQAVLSMRLRCVASSSNAVCSSSCPASSYALLLQTEATFLCFRFVFADSDALASITATTHLVASSPSPSPPPSPPMPPCPSPPWPGSLIALQRDVRVFGPCLWASWEGRKAGEDQLTPNTSIRLIDESEFDVESFISHLPRVGEDSVIQDYAVAPMYGSDELCHSCLSSTSLSSPCPIFTVLGILQRVGDERLAVHFAILHFDLITRWYSWRLVDWSAERYRRLLLDSRCSGRLNPDYYAALPVIDEGETRQLQEDEASVRPRASPHALTVLGYSARPTKLSSWTRLHASELSHLCLLLCRELCRPTPPTQGQTAAAAIVNTGVLQGRSLTQLKHPQGAYTLTL